MSIIDKFEPSMQQLDAMIKKLETNLGKKHSVSPFDGLRQKFGAAPAKPAAQPVEEEKAPAAKQPQQEKAAGGDQPKKEKKEKKEKGEKKPKAPPAAAPDANLSQELQWFNQCDLRVGKIVECKEVAESEKLMDERIDIGHDQIRNIGSGVRPAIMLDEMLKDEFVCVFVNLKAKKLGPIAASHGMVMCANHEGAIELVRPPKGSKLGERISLEGNPVGDIFSQDLQDELKPKKKVMESFLPLNKSNDACEATYNGVRLVTSAGPCRVATLKNTPIK